MNQFMNELGSSKAFRIVAVVAVALLALFLLVKTWDTAFGYSLGEPYNTITVEGTGEAAAIPDVAEITFTVMQSAASVAEAQTAATEKTNAALEFLEGQGVEEKDVKTLSYNVSPQYEYSQPCAPGMYCAAVVRSNPRIVGYEVSQTVSVKVRDTAKAGEVLQGLGSLGVQNISGPNFVVDEEDAVRAEAREEAINEARAKAKELAKQLGVRLGKVVSFSENGNYPMPMYESYGKGDMDMAVAQSAAPTLPAGENESKVTVMITYEIR